MEEFERLDGHVNTALLLSGGMDSVAIAAWKRPDICLTIDYGQKSAVREAQVSASVCRELKLHHITLRADCSSLGIGDLSNNAQIEIAPAPEWWPYRNQLLITLAAMRVLPLGVSQLLFGSVRTDDFIRDGRTEFFVKMNDLLHFQEGNMTLSAPALHLTTAELVKISGIETRLLSYCHSCHTGDLACGRCRGCSKHRQVMSELGLDVY